MTSLYFLAFRDIATASTAVTSGELYELKDISPATTWTNVGLSGANWVPWSDVPDVFRGKRVCFLVHGFNANVDHGVKGGGPAAQEYESLGALGLGMTGADIVVTVLWPGDGFILWSYFTAFDHCKTTGKCFADFLNNRAFTGSEVSFISHSLGARVVLETVAQSAGTRVRFDTAVLTAAAVDDNALDDRELAAGTAGLRRIVVLSSREDKVLQVAFVAGDLGGRVIEAAMWRDYDGDTRALGRYGPVFKAGSPAPAKTEWYALQNATGQDHGDYLPAGWDPAQAPSGWSKKRQDVSRFCGAVLDPRPFGPALTSAWGVDNTARFRPGWTPTL